MSKRATVTGRAGPKSTVRGVGRASPQPENRREEEAEEAAPTATGMEALCTDGAGMERQHGMREAEESRGARLEARETEQRGGKIQVEEGGAA